MALATPSLPQSRALSLSSSQSVLLSCSRARSYANMGDDSNISSCKFSELQQTTNRLFTCPRVREEQLSLFLRQMDLKFWAGKRRRQVDDIGTCESCRKVRHWELHRTTVTTSKANAKKKGERQRVAEAEAWRKRWPRSRLR